MFLRLIIFLYVFPPKKCFIFYSLWDLSCRKFMQSPSSPPLNLSILEYQSLPPNTHIYTHRPTKEIHKIKQNYTFTPNVQTNRTQNALMNIEHVNFDIVTELWHGKFARLLILSACKNCKSLVFLILMSSQHLLTLAIY